MNFYISVAKLENKIKKKSIYSNIKIFRNNYKKRYIKSLYR